MLRVELCSSVLRVGREGKRRRRREIKEKEKGKKKKRGEGKRERRGGGRPRAAVGWSTTCTRNERRREQGGMQIDSGVVMCGERGRGETGQGLVLVSGRRIAGTRFREIGSPDEK